MVLQVVRDKLLYVGELRIEKKVHACGHKLLVRSNPAQNPHKD
ncbi:hypothetical protein [Cuspidothrix issatschenkoi]|nr:hypothetical protein [Cuspidothrix issatschenkoi]